LAVPFEHGNKPLVFIKAEEFLDQLSVLITSQEERSSMEVVSSITSELLWGTLLSSGYRDSFPGDEGSRRVKAHIRIVTCLRMRRSSLPP
jgi:hypothetical protein